MRREDLTGLWQAKERGCEKAREALILRYACLVPATRLKRHRTAPVRLHEEMESEGRIMLIRCVDDFDRFRGTQFPTYAITKIWGAMTTVLRNDDWVPRVERERERAGEEALIREVVSLSTLYEQDGVMDELSLADRLPSLDLPVEVQVIRRLERRMLRAFILWLPVRDGLILAASFWGDQCYTSIAARLGISESRVHQIHRESLLRLRGWMERSGYAHE